MNKKFTSEDLFRSKLTETPVPDWKEGWDRMQPVLDESVDKLYPQKRVWLKRLSAAAAVLLLAGLGAHWFLTQPPLKHISQMTHAVINLPEMSAAIQPPFRKQRKDSIGTSKPSVVFTSLKTPAPTYNKLLHQVKEKQDEIPAPPVNNVRNFLPVLPGIAPTIDFPSIQPAKEVVALAHRNSQAADNTIFTAAKEPDVPLMSSAGSTGVKPSPGLHFAVRLNANGASSFGHAATNFSPVLKGTPVDVYPSVYVRKQITSKISLQAGLAVASPVDVQKEGLNRSVSDPLRAMAANVSQSADSMNLSRLYYADIPLTVEYHLNKKLSIGSGLQVSVLEKVIGEKQRLDYNSYGMIALEMPEQPQPGDLTHTKPASGTISPVDLRWVIGLQYRLGKHWNASLQYQYGLTDISSNRAFLNDHINRNNILRAGIGFVIR